MSDIKKTEFKLTVSLSQNQMDEIKRVLEEIDMPCDVVVIKHFMEIAIERHMDSLINSYSLKNTKELWGQK